MGEEELFLLFFGVLLELFGLLLLVLFGLELEVVELLLDELPPDGLVTPEADCAA